MRFALDIRSDASRRMEYMLDIRGCNSAQQAAEKQRG